MAVYDGVVHTKHSERDGEPRLAEGTCVEVRAPMTDAVTGATAADVIRLLRAEGLSEEPPTASDGAQDEQFELIVVPGEPLSDWIIRERR